MSKKKILILSYSHLRSDPRIQRQINALKNDFIIETVAYSDCGDPAIPFHKIYSPPTFSLIRKIKRFTQFILRKYDPFYWDDQKIAVIAAVRGKFFDGIIANDIHTLPLALSISNGHSRVYADLHEFHPKEFEESLKWRLMSKKYLTFLCKKYMPKADVLTTVSESIALEYANFIGIKPIVLTNASSYVDLSPSIVDTNKIKLIHHGAAIRGRQIEKMMNIMEFLDDRYSFCFMLTGTGTNYYNEIVNYSKKFKNIFFTDAVAFQQIVGTINKFDIGVYCLPPTNFNNLNALPNKFFEFIQARLAIVVSPNPEMSDLVKKYELGNISADFSAKAMSEAILKLSANQISMCKINSGKIAKIFCAEKNMEKLKGLVTNMLEN